MNNLRANNFEKSHNLKECSIMLLLSYEYCPGALSSILCSLVRHSILFVVLFVPLFSIHNNEMIIFHVRSLADVTQFPLLLGTRISLQIINNTISVILNTFTHALLICTYFFVSGHSFRRRHGDRV